MSDFRTIGRAAVLLSALLAGGCVYAAESPAPAPAAQPLTWPRVFQEGADTLTMYQPQIEAWDGTTITFRAAIAIESAAGVEPVYGMVRTTAQADVDKAAGTVTLHDYRIVKITIPTAHEREAWLQAILSQRLPTRAKQISLDRLEASAAVSQAVRKQRGLGVSNDPPLVLFSTSPALLVLVDGDPVLRPFAGAERVINTHALIVNLGGAFFLTALNFWYEAPAIGGPWSPLAEPPAALEQIRQAAGDQVDLMTPATGVAPPAAPPALYVSTVPAELIQTDGTPQFIPVADTGLFQAQNSDDAIFLNGPAGEYFVLISGRWFKSPSLARGPWQFISARDLPADFAKIPTDSPRANVLVSVPGTPEAQEALIANCIPQTATVIPGPATVNLLYDGAPDGTPQFEPIEGVPDLQYAPNASLPVIEAGPDSFYCVQNGIWLVAPTPAGPWMVATAVPPALYSIPPSCPIHYVTYCRIYGFTPQSVCVGYTPGYLGTVVSADGVLVYGTGYHYRPRIGRVWIAQPCTYGFDAGFACGPDTAFAFGFSEGLFAGAQPEPYWGPYDWGWRHHFNYSQISVNHVNLYEHWKGNVVSNPQRRAGEEEDARLYPQAPFNPYSARSPVLEHAPAATPSPREPSAAREPAETPAKHDWSVNAKPRPQTSAQTLQTAPVARPNNLFVSVSGDVYRSKPASEPVAEPAPVPASREKTTPAREPAQPIQWEQHTQAGWKPATESPTFQNVAPELNREAAARDIGENRTVNRPASVQPQPSRPVAPSRPPPPPPPPPRQSDDSTRGKR